jgi:hypothetical protein
MKTSSTLSALLGLAFVAALVYALVYAARFGVGLFDGIDRQVTVITGTAALTLLLAASIIASGLRAAGAREELRQRAAAYEGILRLHADAAGDPYLSAGDPAADPALLLHATPAVLGAWLRLRRAEEAGGGAREERANLVRAMRRDLGHRGADVRPDDLLELLRQPVRERV